MKIKIVYGMDMRLWRYNKTDSEPLPRYANLLEHILKTFEFDDIKQFRITFKDDDDEKITMTSQEDFKDAFTYAQKADKKSLKLYIIDTAEPHYFEEKESINAKEQKQPININNNNNNNNANDTNTEPTEEEINAFLSDDLIMDLLSDLFISVFEALQASNFEISFTQCISGIILSSSDKYNKLTSSNVWPYFMNTLLPNISHKIDQFMIPMIKMNGINSQMIKQWIPTLFNIMKYHSKNNNSFCGKWKNKPWKHHRHHRHHRGHHHGHGHGYHGHDGHHRGGWRGRGRYAYNNQYHPHHANYQNYGYDNRQQNEDDEIEQDVFMYTEELVQIMNMGFKNMNEIKKLLNEHKGDKQLVVQQLVSKQNK